MLLLALGALLATTLLAAAPIYADAMTDVGLRFRLERSLDEPRERVPHLYADGLRLADPVQLAQARALREVTEARVGWLGDALLVEQRSDPLTLDFAAGGDARAPWRARLVHLDGYESHVSVVDGRLPSPGTAEVVLPDSYRSVVATGDRVRLTARALNDCRRVPGSEDENVAADEVRCQPSTFARTTTEAEIVGFVRLDDPADLRWQLFEDRELAPGGSAQPDDGAQWMPLLTSGDYFNGALTERMPELLSRYRVGIVADADGLAVRDVPRALDDLAAWPDDASEGLGLAIGGRIEFAGALARFRNASTFSQVPLLLLLLQVAGVVAFYIVVLASLVRERQADEVAVYRGRGAGAAQLLGLSLVEGLLIAVPAALLGPVLARLAVGALGYTPAFSAITGGEALPASAGEDAFLLAAGGAALALAAMLLPTIGAVRRAVADARREQARPPERGWFRRYHLDLALVALAALLFWQLERRGAVFDPESVGGLAGRPAAPALAAGDDARGGGDGAAAPRAAAAARGVGAAPAAGRRRHARHRARRTRPRRRVAPAAARAHRRRRRRLRRLVRPDRRPIVRGSRELRARRRHARVGRQLRPPRRRRGHGATPRRRGRRAGRRRASRLGRHAARRRGAAAGHRGRRRPPPRCSRSATTSPPSPPRGSSARSTSACRSTAASRCPTTRSGSPSRRTATRRRASGGCAPRSATATASTTTRRSAPSARGRGRRCAPSCRRA